MKTLVLLTALSGTGNLGSGTYSTTDRHDVTTPTPAVITPVITVEPADYGLGITQA